MKRPAKILHLTDLHLFADQKTTLVGINPLHTFQKVVTKILDGLQQNRPDLVILTGDISQDYSLLSYKMAIKTLQQFSCPIATTMGNHDNFSSFTSIFNNPTQIVDHIANITNWRILLLNSHWAEHVDGKISKADLIFLQEKLAEDTTKPVIIFLHHHVLPVASTWLDKIKLQNSEQFLDSISKYKNVKAVICGHVHQDTTNLYNDVTFLSTPSTSWQFALKSHNFRLDNTMPGYRWIDLHEDGTIKTEVVRIEHDDTFIPDTTSKGY